MMKHALHIAALIGALALSSHALAQVDVADPWVRGTVAQQKATGAFMRLTATEDARLVGASSPAAGVVEIHEMKLVDGVMRMRATPGIDLPTGRAVELKPGGYHVMLMDLKQPLATGATVPITLTFETRAGKRASVEIQAPVRPLAEASGGGHGHGHGKAH